MTDGFYTLSPVFAFNGSSYDSQNNLAADDLRWGEGLLNLLRQRGTDMSAPCLEIGCGTGVMTVGIAAAKEYPFVVAKDMSSAFLRITRNKAGKLSISPDRLLLAIWDCASPEAARTLEASFSLIAARAVLHHFLPEKLCGEDKMAG